ncbi:MAG: twin-arginine translocase subunit TatC [Dehalococcoidia bacterium]|nr:twin-arginine translocase subunit TatC [Dehalococcoidia bacterium]
MNLSQAAEDPTPTVIPSPTPAPPPVIGQDLFQGFSLTEGLTPYIVFGSMGVILLLTLLAVSLVLKWPAWLPWGRPRRSRLVDERGVSTEEMTLGEHLIELRNRLVIAAAGVLVTSMVAFFFWNQLLLFVMDPCKGCLFQAIRPTEQIFVIIRLVLFAGVILATPLIVWQIWAFVAPGLTRTERRYIVLLAPGATVALLAGVSFAYYLVLRLALCVLAGECGELSTIFRSESIVINLSIDEYVRFVTRMVLAIGIIFELPLFMYFFARVRLIHPRMLVRVRRYVVVVAVVLAAIITPTADPFNQALVAIPILILYEIGILLARLAYRQGSADEPTGAVTP